MAKMKKYFVLFEGKGSRVAPKRVYLHAVCNTLAEAKKVAKASAKRHNESYVIYSRLVTVKAKSRRK